tara:strand:- start:33030 stop:33899 length:870 start_codon:yes stop_codon:yes gene_type:complete
MRRIVVRIKYLGHKCSMIIDFLRQLVRVGGVTRHQIACINYGGTLLNKKILVTGGSSGIGFEIAKKCIEEKADVVITGRDEKKLKSAERTIGSNKLKTLVWDISEVVSNEDSLNKAIDLLGGDIDILVNNAGVIDSKMFPDVTQEAWDSVYQVNSKGTFFVTQTICNRWLRDRTRKLKKVLNISSQAAFVGATYPYRLSKWDIAGLTQGLGLKLAQDNIIVNGIAPGIVRTDMQPRFSDREGNLFCPHNPLRRLALPSEIAELAVFLLSDASNFIVGQTIVCDGGFSLR